MSQLEKTKKQNLHFNLSFKNVKTVKSTLNFNIQPKKQRMVEDLDFGELKDQVEHLLSINRRVNLFKENTPEVA